MILPRGGGVSLPFFFLNDIDKVETRDDCVPGQMSEKCRMSDETATRVDNATMRVAYRNYATSIIMHIQ